MTLDASLDYINITIMNLFYKNKIFGFLLTTILIMKCKQLSLKNIYMASLVYIIGTFLHELTHFLFSWIFTLKKPSDLSIWPIKENGYFIFGSVKTKKEYLNSFNAFPIAFAPLCLFFMSLFVFDNFFIFYTSFFEINSFSIILYLFLVTTLLVNSIPSRADIQMSLYKGSFYYWTLFILGVFVLLEIESLGVLNV
jgi:hypothetical protein